MAGKFCRIKLLQIVSFCEFHEKKLVQIHEFGLSHGQFSVILTMTTKQTGFNTQSKIRVYHG
jgi:hypothetical protein